MSLPKFATLPSLATTWQSCLLWALAQGDVQWFNMWASSFSLLACRCTLAVWECFWFECWMRNCIPEIRASTSNSNIGFCKSVTFLQQQFATNMRMKIGSFIRSIYYIIIDFPHNGVSQLLLSCANPHLHTQVLGSLFMRIFAATREYLVTHNKITFYVYVKMWELCESVIRLIEA